jgi:dihydroorotate dehydrogenase electron transfer subunit
VKVAYATVVENERLYGDTYITWFRCPGVGNGAYPGQFLMLRCSDDPSYGEDAPRADDPLLPRPMSYHRVRQGVEGPEWSILYDVVGRGTAWLAGRAPGDHVYCWGPLGNGYKVGAASHNLLLVAGGIGVAPLVWLADDAIAQGRNVVLVLGGRSQRHIFPSRLLPSEVEVIVTTDDGSAGRAGLATEPFGELLEWCDQAFACGPSAMFRAIAEISRKAKVRRSVQALLEERMGCGTGICYGCAVEVRVRGGRAVKLVCKDGPRFEVRDVY